jgi:acyl carrier protein
MKNIDSKIQEIVSEVLNIDKKEINNNSKSGNFQNWDSLANFNILISIEKKFSIKIKTQDYSKLNNVKEIISLVKTFK